MTKSGTEASSGRGRLKQWVIRILAVYLVISVGFYMLEGTLLYHPVRYPGGDWDSPTRLGITVEDVHFKADDGVRLHGWFLPAKGTKDTFLFFHGNAGNLSTRLWWMGALNRLPANVFIIDYRGYGRSEGNPKEQGLYKDAEAAYHWLLHEKSIPPTRLILYGESLGGGPACEIASRFPHGGLILQSTYTSIRDMADEMFGFIPARWFVRQRYENLSKIPLVSSPKLIVHGTADQVIPFHMAERLYDAVQEPRQLLLFEGTGHNDIIDRNGDAILEAIRALLQKVESK